MEKKLATKIQKILPKIPDLSQNISKAIVIEPDDELTLEKKGTIYTVFDISAKKELDTLLVTKVVNDVLHDAYYQSESVSPIQSIEKAVLKLRDNITQLAREGTTSDPLVSFNIGTTILWGNTLYVVQYGNTPTFLMRDGEVKPINSASEGNFSVASGVVKDNDVIILATENFAKRFPPEKLINSSELLMDELDTLEAGIMMRFNVVKTFSKDEIVDFGVKQPEEQVSEKQPTTRRKFKESLKLQKIKRGFKNVGSQEQNTRRLIPVISLLIVLFIFGVVLAIYRSQNKISENTEQPKNVTTEIEPQAENQEVAEIVNVEQDRINRVVRSAPNVFYDLRITNQTANPNSLVIIGDKLIAGDNTNNKLYVSDINTPKFNEIQTTFNGLKTTTKYAGNLAVVDNMGFKVINPTDFVVTETYDAPKYSKVATYLDLIYAIDASTIFRYAKNGDVVEESPWSRNDVVQGARAFAVNVSIYVLTTDSKLLKFTTGELVDFTVEGLDKPLNNASKILASPDLANMYIADNGNQRIVVLSEEGVLVKQYKLTTTGLWSNIKDIAVNEDETKIYVLDDTKVYEVAIELPKTQ